MGNNKGIHSFITLFLLSLGSISVLGSDSFIQSEGLTKEVLPPWYSIQKGREYSTALEGRTLKEFILRAKNSIKTPGMPSRVPNYPLPDLVQDQASPQSYPWKLWVKMDSHLVFPKIIELKDPNILDPTPQKLMSGYGLTLNLGGFGDLNVANYAYNLDISPNIIRNEYATDSLKDAIFQGSRVMMQKRFVLRGAVTPLAATPCQPFSTHYRYEVILWSVLGSTGEFRQRITVAPMPPAPGVSSKCPHSVNGLTQDVIMPLSVAKYVSQSEEYDPVLGTVSKVSLLSSTLEIDKELLNQNGLPLKLRGWREEVAIGNEFRGLAFVIPRYECDDPSQPNPVTLSIFNHSGGTQRVMRFRPLCKKHIWNTSTFTPRAFDLAIVPFPGRPIREVVTPSGGLAKLTADFFKLVSGVFFKSSAIYGPHSDQAVYKIGFGLPVKYYGLPFIQKITNDRAEELKINYHRGKLEGTLDDALASTKLESQYIIPYSAINILPTKLPAPWASHAIEDSYDLAQSKYIKTLTGATSMGIMTGFFNNSSLITGTKWAPFLFPWIANEDTPYKLTAPDYNPYGWTLNNSGGVTTINGELRYAGNASVMGICPMSDETGLSRCRDRDYKRIPVTFRAMCSTHAGYRNFVAQMFKMGKEAKGLPDATTAAYAAQGGYFDATNSPIGCRDPLTQRLAGEFGSEYFKFSTLIDRRELVRAIYGQTVVLRESGIATGYLDSTYVSIHHVAKPIYAINTFSDAILTGERLYQPFFRTLYDLPDGTHESDHLDLSRFTDLLERKKYFETQFVIKRGMQRPAYCKSVKDLDYKPQTPAQLPYCPNYSLVSTETYAFNYAPGTHGFVNFMNPQVYSGGDIIDTKLNDPDLEKILVEKSSEDLIKHGLVYGFPIIPSRMDSTLIKSSSAQKSQVNIRPGNAFKFIPASLSGIGNGANMLGSQYLSPDGKTILKFEYQFPYRNGP